MSIVPSIRRNIIFNKSFPDSIKEEICERFFEKIYELKLTSLYDMTYNYSAEGGFEMPKTAEWIQYLNQQDDYTREMHKYKQTRQLRFMIDENNNINGGYCKDNINIFTDYELNTILNIMNTIINDLLIPKPKTQIKYTIYSSLTNAERFNLHQADIDQEIIDQLDKEDIQYSHEYIQELVKESLRNKNIYDKRTKWIKLTILNGNVNEQSPNNIIYLDLDKLKLINKKQLIGFCNYIQFAGKKHGVEDFPGCGEFSYSHTLSARLLQNLYYLDNDILNNDELDDLTIIPITFKNEALELKVMLQNA
jgi:hypothetical protein